MKHLYFLLTSHDYRSTRRVNYSQTCWFFSKNKFKRSNLSATSASEPSLSGVRAASGVSISVLTVLAIKSSTSLNFSLLYIYNQINSNTYKFYLKYIAKISLLHKMLYLCECSLWEVLVGLELSTNSPSCNKANWFFSIKSKACSWSSTLRWVIMRMKILMSFAAQI